MSAGSDSRPTDAHHRADEMICEVFVDVDVTESSLSAWTHEIRGEDVVARRLSITFRTVRNMPAAH